MSLKDMALTAEEAKEYSGEVSMPNDMDKYPYGLCLCLNDGTMVKLGIGQMPPVGSQVQITAIATVTNVGERQEMDGDKQRNMDLQITQMEVDTHIMKPTETDRANVLYGAPTNT